MKFFTCQRIATQVAISILATASLLLSACETSRDPQTLQNPNYVSGYADGCQSGQSRIAGFDDTIVRNNALAQVEPIYDMGWRDGFAACGNSDSGNSDSFSRETLRRESDLYETAPY